MAGAMAAFFTSCYPEKPPKMVVVEPYTADCLYQTAVAGDGKIHAVSGEMQTIMAGLACGEPCSLAWDLLNQFADAFLVIPDALAAWGMRMLGSPMGADPRIISGESGASTFGTVTELLLNPSYAELRNALQLNGDARILCISTEGATDQENYLRIVWDGRYPSE